MITGFDYTAVVLCGGQGSRMGGADKGLLVWQGKPLVDHVIDQLKAQSVVPTRILISANRNLDFYRHRATVFTDVKPGYEGPLRGIQVALRQCNSPYLLVVPCDSPLLFPTLAQDLYEQGAGLAAYATVGATDHPLICLLPQACLISLESYLDANRRRVKSWLAEMRATAVKFSDHSEFLNLNSPDLLA